MDIESHRNDRSFKLFYYSRRLNIFTDWHLRASVWEYRRRWNKNPQKHVSVIKNEEMLHSEKLESVSQGSRVRVEDTLWDVILSGERFCDTPCFTWRYVCFNCCLLVVDCCYCCSSSSSRQWVCRYWYGLQRITDMPIENISLYEVGMFLTTHPKPRFWTFIV